MYRAFRVLVVFNTACLVLISDAPGQHDASSPDGAVAARAADVMPDARWERNAQGGAIPGIISSDPPSGSIDARQPSEPGNPTMRWGWDSIDLVFDGDTASVTPADFAIVVTDGTAPTVSGVVSSGSTLTLLLDGPIPPGAWTTITHAASGTSVQLGFLPGDVNGDGYAGSLDLLALVDAINGVGNALPLWATDTDRSGGIDESDITACTELLGMPGTSGSWNGRSLPGVQNSSNAPGGGVPQAIIELVPATAGPYPAGSTVTVDVWIHNQVPDNIELRLIQFDSTDTAPNLTLPAALTFDFSTLVPSGPYITFASFPFPSTVYLGSSPIAGRILVLPGLGSLHIGQIENLGLPEISGIYLLDVMNADEPNPNFGAILSFGFGVEPDDPVTQWRAFTEELVGGTLGLEVRNCLGDLECDDGNPCTDGACINGVCQFTPDDTNDPNDGVFCNGVEGSCQNGEIVFDIPPPVCNDGLSCTSDLCEEDSDTCAHEIIVGFFCLIDGVCYLNGDRNPNNGCELCDSIVNPTGWSPDPAGCPNACCLPDGSCAQIEPSECIDSSGVPQGPATVCEGDADGDGVDGLCGDVCPNDDPDDTDADGVCDSDDRCPGGDDTVDTDSDGVPDFCDACPFDRPDDTDGDGVCDSDDPCPLDNPDDTDGDGVCDSDDLCPGVDDSIDADGDSRPDACDPCPIDSLNDIDADGLCESVDPCPFDNPDDPDGDGACGTPSDSLPKIYWSDREAHKIQRSNLDGSDAEDVVSRVLDIPLEIALDLTEGKIYWTDFGAGTVQRANLDGTDIEDVFFDPIARPAGIALDLEAGKVYWTDRQTLKIQRASLDGTNVEDLIVEDLIVPAGIALDLGTGLMYWADFGTNTISRANLDGSAVEVLVSDLDFPLGIALDLPEGKIYWNDQGTQRIQRANLDGSNVENVVLTGGLPSRIALDLTTQKIYWTDTGADMVRRANLDGSQVETLVSTGLEEPRGIAIDLVGRDVYWVDLGINKIQSMSLDTLEVDDVIVGTGPFNPASIALDLVHKKIFWVSNVFGGGEGHIGSANLNGTGFRKLGVVNPNSWVPGLAVDPEGQKLYWSTSIPLAVFRANLDGFAVEELVADLSSRPRGITLDFTTQKLYWAQEHLADSPGRIVRANFDGTEVENVIVAVDEVPIDPGALALDEDGQTLYWSNIVFTSLMRMTLGDPPPEELAVMVFWEWATAIALDRPAGKMYWAIPITGVRSGRIQRVNLDGSGVETLNISGLMSPSGLAIWPRTGCETQPGDPDSDGDGQPDFCDPCPADNPDDPDGDGVCASDDLCPGGNDTIDSDGDGVPDLCDPCPADPTPDSDGDGVCDSVDICPGLNDSIDADGDGIPDCLGAIPTVSQWGLVVLTLLLLTAWKIRFRNYARSTFSP